MLKTIISLPTIFYKIHGLIKALVISPDHDININDAIKLYGQRFRIETGYRDKHHFLTPTCSRHASVRLFLFLMSCILWNIWQLFLYVVKYSTNDVRLRKYVWNYRIPMIKLLWITEMIHRDYKIMEKGDFL